MHSAAMGDFDFEIAKCIYRSFNVKKRYGQ